MCSGRRSRATRPTPQCIQPDPSLPHGGGAEALARGVLQVLGARVVEEDVGGIDLELEEDLVQADIQGEAQVEARGDGPVDLPQRGEPLHAAEELSVQAPDLLLRPLACRDLLEDDEAPPQAALVIAKRVAPSR